MNASSGFDKVTNQYGYFPFNEKATSGAASTYNYGFGTKLQMDFTLTDDGMVETEKADGQKVKTSIKFFFSGDDDVWVFIDGKLALDVGGAHGKVSGLLEFGATKTEDGKEKNSVTAYVSKVKQGGTSGSDQDKNSVKSVTYNGEPIDFYAQGTTLTFDKGQKHTLTMYYMERGMWESNMAVAFNFPDNNELQVQKEVDLKSVTDDDFKKCFTGQKIFNFTIQNQATHYGTKPAAGPDESENPSQHVDLTARGNTIEPATKQTESNKGDYIFELADNPNPDPGNENEKVLHWYARYPDTEPVSYWRKQRYGILTLENPIDIEKMRFLTFQVYVDPTDNGGALSLNNLYLELLDEQKVQKGSLGTTGINGATYGSVELETGKWVTVKLDLNKMKKQDGFNNKVKFIRVGDNYSRHIYFRDFTFIPKAVPTEMTGFTTDQKEIPDYGSAKSGHLQNAENAQYTSTMDNETQLVDKDGRFVLEAGETVTFSDQFRRGSYISLKEELNKNLYDTKWTVYENGQAVKSTEPTSTDYTSVKLGGEPKSLESQHSPDVGPDDDRTEVYVDQEGVKNDGYTENKKPTTANTIVFRSYKDPDEKSSTLTKLKVEYVNTVKTGGLKIQKQAADGEKENIKGTYKFKVTFDNVGGEGLEEDDIIRYVEIDMNNAEKYPDHTVTITGIPVGTHYTIEEVGSTDGAKLQSVTVPPDCHSAHEINNNTMVEGVIKEANTYPITAIFTNTQRTLINIEFDKLWKDANGTDDLSTANQPKQIHIQLQRRLTGVAAEKFRVRDAVPRRVVLRVLHRLRDDLYADDLPRRASHGQRDGADAAVQVQHRVGLGDLRLRDRHLVQPLRLMVVHLIKRPGGQAEIQAAEGVLDIAGAVEGEKAVAQHGVAPLRVHGQHQRGKAGNPTQPLDERFRPGNFFPVHRETYQNLPGHRAPADVNMPQKPLAGGLVVDADPVLVYIINYRILRGVDLLRENAAPGVFHHVVGTRPVESGIGAPLLHCHRILRLVAVAVAVGGGENGDFFQIFAADAV